MAASSEIRFKIGADTSALSRGFAQAQSIAAVAGKQIERKLGMKDAFKASAIALGLDVTRIADSIARSIAGMPEWAEESYRRIVAAGDKATEAIRRQIAGRQTAEQQLRTLQTTTRREDRAGGMKEQTGFQRYLSNLPVVGGFIKNIQESKGIFSAEERIAGIEEERAANQDRANQEEELKNKIKDTARARRDDAAAKEIAQRAASGQKSPASEHERYIELIRQENDLRREANDKTTSAARRQELLARAEQLSTQQLQMAAHWREANRATAEKIEEVERGTAALGESQGQRINRIKREALDLDRKSKDLTRSEDDRRQFRVQAAEKVAAAAKAEYDWRVRTANISDSLRTPSGRRNTTAQGTRARQASSFRNQANRARAEGRFGAAAHFTDLANSYEDAFTEADSAGMKEAFKNGTAGTMGDSVAGRPSPWDVRNAKAMEVRRRILQVPPRGVPIAGRVQSATSAPPPASKGDDKVVAALATTNKKLDSIDTSLKPKPTK